MIHEMSRRRPTFDEGNSVAVTLADGQAWRVPKPDVEWRARFKDGVAAAVPYITYDAMADGLLTAIGANAAEDQSSLIVLVATLGAHLLRRQYDLDDQDLDGLLAWRPSDPASMEWIPMIVSIAAGNHGVRTSTRSQ